MHFKRTSVAVVAALAVVVASPPCASAAGAPQPSRGQVLFQSDRGGDNDIYLANADGSNPVRLTSGGLSDTAPYQDVHASWDPRNQSVFVFARYVNFQRPPQLLRKDLSTGVVTELTAPSLEDRYDYPVYSPDGTRLMVATFEFDGRNVTNGRKVINIASGAVELTISGAFTGTWSPDGTKIAFTRLRSPIEPYENIYMINADGSGETRLSWPGDHPTQSRRIVSWQGDRLLTLAFSEKTEYRPGLRTMNTDGSREVIFPEYDGATDFAEVGAVR